LLDEKRLASGQNGGIEATEDETVAKLLTLSFAKFVENTIGKLIVKSVILLEARRTPAEQPRSFAESVF
jgi:hypothetical protein